MRISDWSSDVCSSDLEFVLADRSSLLLGATFGIISQFSANAIGPVYPVSAPALSARLETDRVTSRIGVYDGTLANRSEERRVGKECVSKFRSRWSPYN